MAVLWIAVPCSLVEVYQCFRGARSNINGATQMTAIFILTAVKTWNLIVF
jgi:hypothetical protein